VHDEGGNLVVGENGLFVLRKVPRKQLNLPHFHSLRHTAAMECDDAEEARDLLRHKNSNVTRAVYRAHFSDQRRELLRAKTERDLPRRWERSWERQAATVRTRRRFATRTKWSIRRRFATPRGRAQPGAPSLQAGGPRFEPATAHDN
jgi:hypothetical protein